MSTMKKRIPMFLLALAMMVAMALPTFADWSLQPDSQPLNNNYLNIYRNSSSEPINGKSSFCSIQVSQDMIKNLPLSIALTVEFLVCT